MDMLLTGGIGDVLTIDAHLTAAEKAEITTIQWGTRSGRDLSPIFERLPQYVNLARQIDHWPYGRTDGVACYHHAGQAREFHAAIPADLLDRSVSVEWPRIVRDDIPYHGSSFLETRLAEIRHLGLPEHYAVCTPYTPANHDDHRKIRDYTPQDWADTLDWLRQHHLPAVVVNAPCSAPVPDHQAVINLTGLTTLAEAMEVVKGASAYVGIDSWASILAAMHLPSDKLAVLSRNTYLYGHRRQYYPRFKSWPFIDWEIPILISI
jgi:hypothetical protein